MYNYIYIIFYKLYVRRTGNLDSKEEAASVVLWAVFSHVFFLLTVTNYFTGYNLLVMAFGENHSKYFWLTGVILIMINCYKY
jgi:hypothetical protein